MTIVDFFAVLLIASSAAMIWGSLQTIEEDGPKAYKKDSEDLWVETRKKVKKPKYPKLWEPVSPPKK